MSFCFFFQELRGEVERLRLSSAGAREVSRRAQSDMEAMQREMTRVTAGRLGVMGIGKVA